jgi:hypothetical protein
MGIDQPKVSALLNGRWANFSSERLMRLLTALGQAVEIMVETKPRNQPRDTSGLSVTSTSKRSPSAGTPDGPSLHLPAQF